MLLKILGFFCEVPLEFQMYDLHPYIYGKLPYVYGLIKLKINPHEIYGNHGHDRQRLIIANRYLQW